MPPRSDTVADRLRLVLAARSLSQRKAAVALGTSQPRLSRILSDDPEQNEVPTLEWTRRAAGILGCEWSEIDPRIPSSPTAKVSKSHTKR